MVYRKETNKKVTPKRCVYCGSEAKIVEFTPEYLCRCNNFDSVISVNKKHWVECQSQDCRVRGPFAHKDDIYDIEQCILQWNSMVKLIQ